MCEWLSCNQWYDVQLSCGSRIFNAHRAVLASVSKFLRYLLIPRSGEEDLTCIVLPEFEYEAMVLVLNYIYKGEVNVSTCKLEMFLEIINTLQIFIDNQYLTQISNITDGVCNNLNKHNECVFDDVNPKFTQFRDKQDLVESKMQLPGFSLEKQDVLETSNLRDKQSNYPRHDKTLSTSRKKYLTSIERQLIQKNVVSEKDNKNVKEVPSLLTEHYQSSACDSSAKAKRMELKYKKIGYCPDKEEYSFASDTLGNCKSEDLNVKNSETYCKNKIPIQNSVLQSPWCPQLPKHFQPFRTTNLEVVRTNDVEGCKIQENDNTENKLHLSFKNKNVENATIIPQKSVQDLKCTICCQVFPNQDEYIKHEHTASNNKYSCTECKKEFSQLRNFKYHMSIHRGTKEFATTCPVCGKYFNDRGYLSSHMKIHRNRKEYKCPTCPKSFNQRVAYNMHLRIHTGVKPHACSECGKAFSRKILLKQHHRTHSGERPYACPHCDRKFADRSNMTLHLRLHTGVKPFECSECGKSFTKKHHLQSHMNFHTGKKPYACPKCELTFTQSSNMRTHSKKCGK